MRVQQVLLSALIAAFSCARAAEDGDVWLSAGAFTVPVTDAQAYSQPAPVLSERQRAAFARGRAAFDRPWVVFAVSTGDWGLGPT